MTIQRKRWGGVLTVGKGFLGFVPEDGAVMDLSQMICTTIGLSNAQALGLDDSAKFRFIVRVETRPIKKAKRG